MQQPFENPESQEIRPKSSGVTRGIAVMVAAAILISVWFLFEPLGSRRASSLHKAVAVMNPAELDYAKKIEIGNLALSRAENFLHQEVTTLNGELYNGGSQRVFGLRLTTEFADDMNQIVLRETRSVLGSSEAALSPGERRSFEISFEHIPRSWNRQAPNVRVARLRLNSPER